MVDQLTLVMSGVGRVTLEGYLSPILTAALFIAGLVATLFISLAGLEYITSQGQPMKLARAKRRLRQAIAGLAIVLASGALVGAISTAWSPETISLTNAWPQIEPIPVDDQSLLGSILNLLIGGLEHLILSLAQPLLEILEVFSTSTPLMQTNPTIGDLWLVVLGISQALLVVVLIAIGFMVMVGNYEFDWRSIIVRLILTVLVANLSLYLIDSLISFSNVLITSLPNGAGANLWWQSLGELMSQSSQAGLAALFISAFSLLMGLALAIYYLARLVTLSVGAVLSPLIILLSLIPTWQGFCQALIRRYLTTIFILFVHNITLILASGLLLNFGQGGLLALLLSLAVFWSLLLSPFAASRLAKTGISSLRSLRSQLASNTSQTLSHLRQIENKAVS